MNALYESTTHFKKGSVARSTEAGTAQRIYAVAASLDGLGMNLLRLGLVIVLVWIGGLKFARYEAEGIVPLVANSPCNVVLLSSSGAGVPALHEQRGRVQCG
jgi:hypothetical protein